MLFSPIAWALFAFTLAIALPGALASPSPKRKRHSPSTKVIIESYPALESTETVEISEPAQILPFRPRKSASKPTELGAPAPLFVETIRPGVIARNEMTFKPAPPAASKFEFVPEEKRGQILRRLRLCATLFEKTGRAYDYRSMTTRELESELVAAQSAKAQPAVDPIAPDPIAADTVDEE